MFRCTTSPTIKYMLVIFCFEPLSLSTIWSRNLLDIKFWVQFSLFFCSIRLVHDLLLLPVELFSFLLSLVDPLHEHFPTDYSLKTSPSILQVIVEEELLESLRLANYLYLRIRCWILAMLGNDWADEVLQILAFLFYQVGQRILFGNKEHVETDEILRFGHDSGNTMLKGVVIPLVPHVGIFKDVDVCKFVVVHRFDDWV
jgi:hypothetical protein